MKVLSKAISAVLHPILIPIYIVLIIFSRFSPFSITPPIIKFYIYIFTILFLFIIPISGIYILKRFKVIKTYSLDDREDRIYPLVLTICSAVIALLLIVDTDYTQIFRLLLLFLITILSLVTLVSTYWKISVHMTSIGALSAYLLLLHNSYGGDTWILYVISFILSGFLAAARLNLGKHNIYQIISGFLLGNIFIIIIA